MDAEFSCSYSPVFPTNLLPLLRKYFTAKQGVGKSFIPFLAVGFFPPGLELIFNGSCWVPWESVKMVISAGLIFAVILVLAEPGW